jgi:hypothetical protein
MTKPDEEKELQDKEPDEITKLSKETLEDLDPDEEARDVRGGQPCSRDQSGCR